MATSGDCPRSESQGEEPVECSEAGLLQEGVQPEEFVAIADYAATDETQLSFLRGEKILILRQTTADWWWGERAGCCGYIPANHVGKHVDEYDPEDTWQDEEYFGSYGTLKLHLEMLADQPRTTKYHSVILQNKESLTDKVILDVGCGTGIISLFCAHYARPKAVYAVEASEMAQHTGQLVLQNGFADIITVYQQKVEDVVLPEKVDVLVSEWMGTCLLLLQDLACSPEATPRFPRSRLHTQQSPTSQWHCRCRGCLLDFRTLCKVTEDLHYTFGRIKRLPDSVLPLLVYSCCQYVMRTYYIPLFSLAQGRIKNLDQN
ncbi:protein arginine N-methyltransferase 2 isoform X2 [Pan troglodytes]|uniref:protein arginine N-methyltransferase 2 isoform X2 n=1 Tax=Pan troglodytes TaxID=9598 RepID=UPI0023F528D9|nr:protein arginine N-methyltransferase 2 isoform X2 [Pan troglodytes]